MSPERANLFRRLAVADPDPQTFLRLLDGLPATLGIWRAGPEALPAVLRAVALARHLDEEHPTRQQELSGRDMDQWVRRWQSATGRLVVWAHRFAGVGSGPVRQQDVYAAVRLAVRWLALDGAREGIARGDWAFSSDGFNVRL